MKVWLVNCVFRSTLELVLNADHYQQLPDAKKIARVCPTFKQACLDCGISSGWSSAWTIQALSNVLLAEIVAVYPPMNGTKDIAYKTLNTLYQPTNGAPLVIQEVITVMWTRLNNKRGSIWVPNHFVPLIHRHRRSNWQMSPETVMLSFSDSVDDERSVDRVIDSCDIGMVSFCDGGSMQTKRNHKPER